jgi:uncharacterized protein (UPF0335 family)
LRRSETFRYLSSLTVEDGARLAIALKRFQITLNQEINSMKKATLLATTMLIALLPIITAAQEISKGEWMCRYEDGKFWLALRTESARDNSMYNWSFNLQLDKIKGLTMPPAGAASTPVHFELVRDAGTIVFDGTMRNGSGIGDYQFTASQDYISAMKSMGYTNLTSEQLLRLAVRDVNRGYVREMRTAGFDAATVEEIIRLRNHDITSGFIAEMKLLGFDGLSVDQIVRMKNHKISAAFIQEMKSAGYEGLSVEQLVRLSNHQIDGAFIKSVADAGYKSISVEQLIRMRNRSVTPDYIRDLKSAGYDNIPVETLIRMRSRDVTPGFIKQLSDSGYKNLSPDDLIYIRDRGVEAYSRRHLRRAQ